MWSGCGNYWRSCRDALRRRAGLRPSKFLRPTRKFYVLLVASQYVVVQSFANLKLADPKINALLGSTQSWSLRSSSLSGLATTNFANLFSLDYEVTNRRRRLFGNRLQRCGASMTRLRSPSTIGRRPGASGRFVASSSGHCASSAGSLRPRAHRQARGRQELADEARSILEARPSSPLGRHLRAVPCPCPHALAEFFWLEQIEGPSLRVATVAPYVDAGLLAALPTLDRSALLLRRYKQP